MVRVSRVLLKDGGVGISKALSEILVCPLSKQPLRVCEKSNSLISDAIGVSYPKWRKMYLLNSLISDAIGVSYPIVDGIPCLVPKDGKIIEADDTLNPDDVVNVRDTK